MLKNNMVNTCGGSKSILLLTIAVFILLLTFSTANAHRVTVFAWVEGDTIFTESKFSGGKKVRGGRIIVYDLKGTRLLEGQTNNQGEFSFKIPKKTAMKIVMEAGTGHRGEWTLSVEEFGEVDIENALPSTAKKRVEKETEKQAQPVETSPAHKEAMRIVMEQALDKKLKPVIRMLAGIREEKEVTLKDIIGGIGYILGLMGIASYFNYRRRPETERKKSRTNNTTPP